MHTRQSALVLRKHEARTDTGADDSRWCRNQAARRRTRRCEPGHGAMQGARLLRAVASIACILEPVQRQFHRSVSLCPHCSCADPPPMQQPSEASPDRRRRRRRHDRPHASSILCTLIAMLLCILSSRSPHRTTLLAVVAQQSPPFATESHMDRLAFVGSLPLQHDVQSENWSAWITRTMTLVAGQWKRKRPAWGGGRRTA